MQLISPDELKEHGFTVPPTFNIGNPYITVRAEDMPGNNNGLCRRFFVNDEIIDAIPTIEVEPRWIPCSERLPEEMGTYMTTIDYEKYGRAVGQRYYHGVVGWEDEHVVAWMPLPEPYREVGKMSDLISRQAAVDAVYERIRQLGYENDAAILSIRQSVRDVPVIEAEPVKHGRWIWRGGNLYECSECEAIVVAQDYIPIELHKFCRGCGAYMRERGEDGNTD